MPDITSIPPWKRETVRPSAAQTILVVDDMAIVRDRVCDLLIRHGHNAIAAESGEAALAVAQSGQPIALAVLDILMPDARIEGIEAARALTYTYAIPCLMLTTIQEAGTRAAALFAGALGYLVKDVATGDAAILAGVRAALAGEPVPDPLANLPIDDTEIVSIHQRRRFLDDAYGQLTPRQREVAHLAAQGLTNEEIGAQLHIEVATVNSHIGEVLGRLRLTGRRDLRPRVIYDSLRDPAP
jgi:two-component system response regulator NreC